MYGNDALRFGEKADYLGIEFAYVFHTSRTAVWRRQRSRSGVFEQICYFLILAYELNPTWLDAVECIWMRHRIQGGNKGMLETIIVLLLVLWLVGLVTSNTFGGILHLLLLVAVVVFVIRLLTGRRAV